MSEHWEHIGQCFTTPCLSNPDHISATHDCWNCLHLDWSWLDEISFVNETEDAITESALIPVEDGTRRLETTDLDVVVLFTNGFHLFRSHEFQLVTLNVEELLEALVLDLRMVNWLELSFLSGSSLPT